MQLCVVKTEVVCRFLAPSALSKSSLLEPTVKIGIFAVRKSCLKRLRSLYRYKLLNTINEDHNKHPSYCRIVCRDPYRPRSCTEITIFYQLWKLITISAPPPGYCCGALKNVVGGLNDDPVKHSLRSSVIIVRPIPELRSCVKKCTGAVLRLKLSPASPAMTGSIVKFTNLQTLGHQN